jgi:hypothetical protein
MAFRLAPLLRRDNRCPPTDQRVGGTPSKIKPESNDVRLYY